MLFWPPMIMESPVHNRDTYDIQATVKKHANFIPKILATHALSGCDTVTKSSTVIRQKRGSRLFWAKYAYLEIWRFHGLIVTKIYKWEPSKFSYLVFGMYIFRIYLQKSSKVTKSLACECVTCVTRHLEFKPICMNVTNTYTWSC